MPDALLGWVRRRQISQRIREQEGRLAGAVWATGDNGSLLTMGLQKGRLWEVEAAGAALLLKRGEAGRCEVLGRLLFKAADIVAPFVGPLEQPEREKFSGKAGLGAGTGPGAGLSAHYPEGRPSSRMQRRGHCLLMASAS